MPLNIHKPQTVFWVNKTRPKIKTAYTSLIKRIPIWGTFFFCFCQLTTIELGAAPYFPRVEFWQAPPRTHGAYSTFTERVLNRKHVRALVSETLGDGLRLTLLVYNPKPWRYKAVAHPLYIPMASVDELMFWNRYLDAYLDSGHNFKIYLNGSTIVKMDFPHTGQQWPNKQMNSE